MLDIDLSLMLFVFVVFFVLLAVLNQTLYKPLLKFMDDRDQSISKDLEMAKGLAGKSESLHAEANKVLEEARNRAAEIRQKAVAEAKLVADGKVHNKQLELEDVYNSFLKKLSGEKETLRASLLAQMPVFKESIKSKFSKL
jgi:F-type H+-transporting ATPase subunit b